MTQVASVPVIMIVTYLVLGVYKVFLSDYSLATDLIPSFAALIGAGLGVLFFRFVPEIIAVGNAVNAAMSDCFRDYLQQAQTRW